MRFLTRAAPLLLFVISATALATMPPPLGQNAPNSAIAKRWQTGEGFTYKRAFKKLVRSVQATRQRSVERYGSPVPPMPFAIQGPVRIEGTRRIPVLLFQFNNSAGTFSRADLQRQLFDGPWPTGTMTDYYREVSYGHFTVTGNVEEWKTVSRDDAYYEGEDQIEGNRIVTCNGVCAEARLGEMLEEVLSLNTNIDWAQYDNDGPDGRPNSPDDDGFVDFVAFVHPEMGGECLENRNIWSHRSSLSELDRRTFETTARRPNGGRIRIDDYVVVPGLACDERTMIQIGVFAHEFAHALDLPDLYDTDLEAHGMSEGVGNWCLMSGGPWGGDGVSPETPTHLSAWAKAYLGWLDLEWISTPTRELDLPPIEETPKAYAIAISSRQYYILDYARRLGFDARLPGEGLRVWKVNDSVVGASLRNNLINADPTNKGVDLVEADGQEGMDRILEYRGGPGDLFPGTANARNFDEATVPASLGAVSLCGIPEPGSNMRLTAHRERHCPAVPGGVVPVGREGLGVVQPPVSGERALHDAQDGGVAPELSVQEVLTRAEALDGRTIRITGTVTNQGNSLFKASERKLVLVDEQGESIPVQLGVPIERHGPPGHSSKGSLPELLDRPLELRAVVENHDGGTMLRVLDAQRAAHHSTNQQVPP
jgi:M6 family metalloprotease-like protein